MASIVEAVLEELKRHDIEKVEEVHMVIGELTFLGKDQLEFAYEIVTRGTILEGSKLVMSDEKVQVSCTTCGYAGGVDYVSGGGYDHVIPNLSCPRCGGAVEVTKGKSCAVTSLKVVER
ncbi:MAG: hydrogenase maturation nickel metallochaperone HypA [Methanomassiliicoccales archaeon]|jgi:hydrogenase nickel incorporation protein HypA/HybF|nr:hydrogenase maturation nickel metallochaperone HypA [Methanomassiliicoccales archaeon]MDD1755593.1 hydrogenase maturation nickel metallochaperone HypA [Methanomassiliicoccales archaeon]